LIESPQLFKDYLTGLETFLLTTLHVLVPVGLVDRGLSPVD